MVETHRYRTDNGTLLTGVSLPDYAALEAQRDALAMRINPDGAPVDVAALCLEIDAVTDELDEWKRKYDEVNKNYTGLVNLLLPKLREAQALAIAEGRDNG